VPVVPSESRSPPAVLSSPSLTQVGGTCRRFVCDDDKDCLFPTAGAFLKSPGSNSLGIDMDDVYFRGDDQQRTLMSGQLLTEALFPTTEEMTGEENVLVEWHTADYKYDPIYVSAPSSCEQTRIVLNHRSESAMPTNAKRRGLPKSSYQRLRGAHSGATRSQAAPRTALLRTPIQRSSSLPPRPPSSLTPCSNTAERQHLPSPD